MQQEELSMDNILGTEEIDNLFTDVSEGESQEETNTEEQKENTTETIDSNDLFE
jgi:flagellar motor switch protein FliM